jgi:hypothetical protein
MASLRRRSMRDHRMIRITFACAGAAGRERLRECDNSEVLYPDSYGVTVLSDAVEYLKEVGWTFRPITKNGKTRIVVRCPKCEALRISRNKAKALRDKLAKER